MGEPLAGTLAETTGGETRDPVAIIGIACRFPGTVDGPGRFWRALREELDAIGEIPADRFDAASLYHEGPPKPGRIGTRWGGFLDRIDEFDAEFFGIAPREAERLDPQQRLLLETSWEALEDGGVPADRVAGSRTGVFMGVWLNDYEARLFVDPAAVDFYMTTGSGRYSASGRISYALGLQGPAITVDTACSSSLVAVHLACRSIWAGESELALAGGANVILQPHITIAYSQSSMMAPDGRCKFGDSRANGYVRSEGAGVVLLKPLARALADGDPIYAVIRGTAVNNDGRSGEYMATPAQAGQEEMLRLAYRDASVSPGRVSYVEAHGTGTGAGDPVELGALGAVLGEGRSPDGPCAVGSVKTNFGHTEGAAGVAGLIKAALVLRHRAIPTSLHFQEPNPKIPWDALPLYIPRALTPIPADAAPAVAGVSSFGIAGTNAHVVLEEAPATVAAARGDAARESERGEPVPHDADGGEPHSQDRTEPVTRDAERAEPGPHDAEPDQLVPLSARSPAALADLARAYVRLLDEGAPELTDLAYSAGCRRAHLEERLAVTAGDRAELRERLQSFANGEPEPGVVTGRASSDRPRLVFVFPGQGSQWLGMARQLMAEEPVFRATIEACEAAMRPLVDWSLLEQLSVDEGSPAYALDRIDVIQPVLVAVDVALAALWSAWGVHPDAVVGHSMGEVAAAHVSGALGLEDALRVVCLRSKLMRRTSGHGLMAAVELSLDEASELLVGYEDRVSIGASNSPRSTILSGDPAALTELVEGLEAREIFCRMVNVDVASHSPQMEPLRAELRAGLDGLQPRAARVPIYSTVTGDRVDGETLDADHWTRNLRQPVLFAGVIERLLEEGHDAFIEVSPHPVLLPAIEQTVRLGGREASTLASLRREQPERATMLQSLGALYVAGYAVDFARLHPADRRVVDLPRYPWQRERFWCEPAAGRRAFRSRPDAHPLLGDGVRSATGAWLWEGELGTELFPYLADHRVRGRAVLPATAYLELALAAAAEAFEAGGAVVTDVVFEEALFLGDDAASTVQVVLEPDGAGTAALRVFSRSAGAEPDSPWTLNARATLLLDADAGAARGAAATEHELEASRSAGAHTEGAEAGGAEDHYRSMAERGLDYGPSFRGIAELWRNGERLAARLDVPEPVAADADAYRLHPALLDAGFQLLLQSADGTGDPEDTYLPASLDRLELHRSPDPGAPLSALAVRRASDPLSGDVHLVDGDGVPVASARGLRFHRLAAGGDLSGWFYRPEWVPAPRAVEAGTAADDALEPGAWLILADEGGVAAELAVRIEALGGTCAIAVPGDGVEVPGDGFGVLEQGRFCVDPARPDALRRLVMEASPAGESLRGVVHLWSLDDAMASDAPPSEAATDRGVVSVLHLVQATAGLETAPRLWLVTAGAQPVGQDADIASVAPLSAPLWGMAGVLAHEHPELRCTCIDLDPTDPRAGVDELVSELREPDREDRLAFRAGERYAARLVRHELEALHPPVGSVAAESADGPSAAVAPADSAAGPDGATPADSAAGAAAVAPAGTAAAANVEPGQSYRVVTTAPGLLDHLTPRLAPRRPPGSGQVEIEVRATGLNFMNVMSALGIYPGYPDGVGPLGIECAGVITAVGAGETGLHPGDEVVAYAFDSLASHAVADANLVAPKPGALGFAEAASLPIAFLTAYYALHHLARIEEGDRVLIHSATGGVGLAALQLARRAGARVFATAGSDQKREHLRSLGVDDVFDSRSLAFADEILDRTDGEGVDIVLNSLAGAAIARGLAILRPYGRFVEIGKRDIYDDARVGLAPFRNNLSYFAVDLERMARERPAVLGRMLRELVALADDGELEPLPLREFPVAEVGEAFRHMAQARHIGKVVVRIQDSSELAGRIAVPPVSVRPDSTYLITGGLGGLGLSVAHWLVEQGARHLVLVGRSAPGETALPELRALESAGARVEVARADVARRAELVAVLERIGSELPPLRGVIHAAGVLADGTVMQTDRERFVRALAPKVEGAWNLHELTADSEIDFFVMFSSATALLGTPGQANYAAANAFLDALAHARRARGLPALSINWGPWSDVGLAAARADRGGRLARQGLGSLSPQQGVAALARLLPGPAPQAAVMRFDLDRWCEFQSAAAESAFFDLIGRSDPDSAGETDSAATGIRSAAAAAAPAERRALLERHLQERSAHVLRLAVDRVALDRPLKSLGMDSLMTLELRNRLEADLGLTLSATVVWNYPTIALLAGHLAERIGDATGTEPAAGSPGEQAGRPSGGRDGLDAGRQAAGGQTGDAEPDGEAVDDLSRDEVESMLASELADIDEMLKGS